MILHSDTKIWTDSTREGSRIFYSNQTWTEANVKARQTHFALSVKHTPAAVVKEFYIKEQTLSSFCGMTQWQTKYRSEWLALSALYSLISTENAWVLKDILQLLMPEFVLICITLWQILHGDYVIFLFHTLTLFTWHPQIQSKNHASNKEKMAGGCQIGIHLMRIGLRLFLSQRSRFPLWVQLKRAVIAF